MAALVTGKTPENERAIFILSPRGSAGWLFQKQAAGEVKPPSKSLPQVLSYLGERMARGKAEVHSRSPMGLTPGREFEEVRVRHSEPTRNGCGLLCHAKPGLVSDS